MSDPELDKILLERAKRITANAPNQKANHIIELTESSFDREIGGEKPVLVDFWASWCGPCKMMEPVVEHLASRYSESVGFGKLNVDEQPAIATRYDVQSIPTFVIFKQGAPVDALIGAVSESVLDQHIRKAIGS